MKTTLLITGTILAIITSLLFQCKKDGLHPNFKVYFLVIVPFFLLMALAKGMMFDNSKKLK